MITLNFSVDDQLLTRTDENTVAANSHLVHVCEFAFSSEWDGRGKVATFKKRDLVLSVILENDACAIPPEILQSENKIDVFELSVCGADGNSTITSTVVKVPILAGTWDVMSTEITPTMFEQIMQKIDEVEKGEVSPELIYEAVSEYMEAHPLEPIVAEDVAAYFEEHKSEFKGDKGDTGATGPKGDTGNGIASIEKTATSGLVDTYTITYTDGTTSTFEVTNGASNDLPIDVGTGTNSLIVNNLSNNIASGNYSHAEGHYTQATAYASHAEGQSTIAQGSNSHAEGYLTTCAGSHGHSEGANSQAIGAISHAQNWGTIAQGRAQTAIGKYNVAQGTADSIANTDYALIIGNGADANHRSNALAIKWDGTVVFQDGSTMQSSKAIYEVMGKVGAKNLIPFPYDENSVTKNNVRFTVNEDTSVTVESIGTISGWTQWRYQNNFKLAKGKYIISKKHIESNVKGCYIFVQDLSNNAFLAQLDDSHLSVEFEVTEAVSAHNLRIFINLDPNKTYSTTVYVMLRHAEDQDPTWYPYVPTNYELMKKDEELMQGVINSATCWGDSLTAMGGWEDTLYNLSGIPFYNAGIGGENSKCIMARQGGDVMIVDGITIPATTTPVLIATRAEGGINTKLGNKAMPLLQGGSNHVNPVTIGDVTGTLAWTGSNYADPNGTWTFTRATAGEEIVIDRPTAIRTNFDINHNSKNELMIIFMGQNDGTFDNDILIHSHKLMIDHFKGKEYIILGLSSGTATSRADYEAAMEEAFGRRFISLREYLAHPIYENGEIVSCYGLADQNLTPTTDDLEKIAIGQVPASCLLDGVHYTVGTREVIGKMLYRQLKELNIL